MDGVRPGPVPRLAGGSAGARMRGRVSHARSCAASRLGAFQWGDRVEVTGELVMERVDGPIEDDLSAVRVWIKASGISLLE